MAIKFGKGGSGASNQERPEDGSYFARLIGMVDIDHQPAGSWAAGGKSGDIEAKNKVAFVYELTTLMDDEGAPVQQIETPNNNIHEKGTIYARMKSLDPTGTATNRFKDPSGLIGMGCMVEIGSTAGGNAKVAGVTSAPAGIPVAEATVTPYAFDFDEPDMEVYDRLPFLVKYKLHQGTNFKDSALHLAMLAGDYDDPLAPKEETNTSASPF